MQELYLRDEADVLLNQRGGTERGLLTPLLIPTHSPLPSARHSDYI